MTKTLSDSAPPLITVIALCYNHARFVLECLESIRAQTYQDFELIVTDDHSQDNSAEIISDWLSKYYPQAIFIRHDKNAGLCRTLNEAIGQAHGQFIAMIATDDKWLPNRLEFHLKRFQELPEHFAVIYSDTFQIDESGNPLPNTFLEAQRPGFHPPSGRVFKDLIDRNFVHPLATTIRRKAIIDVGGYDEQMVVEDYDMWLRLANRYDFMFCPGIVASYRIVSTSMTRTLFSKPTANFSYGKILLCEKWITSGLLTKDQKAQWASEQADSSYWLYFHNDPQARRWLWISLFRTWRPRFLMLAIASSFGISRSVAIKALNIFRHQ
ncbi:MAG: glycosyltransferase [Pseudomonadota bacterium]